MKNKILKVDLNYLILSIVERIEEHNNSFDSLFYAYSEGIKPIKTQIKTLSDLFEYCSNFIDKENLFIDLKWKSEISDFESEDFTEDELKYKIKFI